MPEDTISVGALEIAETIDTALESASADAERANEVAHQIIEGVHETERFREIEEIKRSVEEWQSIISDQSEAIQALTMGVTQLSGQMSVLLTQQPLVTPPPQSVEDGPKENPEPEIPVVIVEPEALAPEPPAPPAPKKKRHNWI